MLSAYGQAVPLTVTSTSAAPKSVAFFRKSVISDWRCSGSSIIQKSCMTGVTPRKNSAIHGKGGTDSAFQWAIKWARHLATETASYTERFDEFLEYLVTSGFADEKVALR